jgi:hypothetical protein
LGPLTVDFKSGTLYAAVETVTQGPVVYFTRGGDYNGTVPRYQTSIYGLVAGGSSWTKLGGQEDVLDSAGLGLVRATEFESLNRVTNVKLPRSMRTRRIVVGEDGRLYVLKDMFFAGDLYGYKGGNPNDFAGSDYVNAGLLLRGLSVQCST